MTALSHNPRPARRSRRCCLLASVSLLLLSCDPSASRRQDILAEVAGEVITAEAFARAAQRRGIGAGIEAKRALLEEMVDDLRMLALARQRGYENDPEIIRRLHELMIAKVRADAGLYAEDTSPPPDEETLQDYYNAHAAEFETPERVRIAWIHAAVPKRLRPEAREGKIARIREAHAIASAQAAGQRSLKELALKYSEDQSTRYAGGDLGYHLAKDLAGHPTPGLAEAVAKLQAPGDLSPVIEAGEECYFVLLLERQPAAPMPFRLARGEIMQRLRKARAAELEKAFLASLQSIPATLDEERLKAVVTEPGRPSAPDAPPAGPSSR